PRERDDRALSFVVLDDQLPHGAGCLGGRPSECRRALVHDRKERRRMSKSSYAGPTSATACLVGVALLVLAACGGTWTGSVGAVFAKDNRTGRVYVREAPADMGAARAGVLVDDEIVAIDGHPVLGMSTQQLHEALAGQVGTKVALQ